MDRTERFYKIELLIRHRGCVSFAELMAELEVSRATLKRDLEYLRTRLDAPIVYDRLDNGYRFEANARDPRQAQHQLPGVWFSEREIHALLTMHQLIEGLDEGGVLARHLQPLLDKLHGMLGESESASREAMRRIRILGSARRPVAHRHFELLGSALMNRRRVAMRYFVRSRREETQREVSPQRLVFYRNTWYLDAWCHASDGLRRFALDAIREAQGLETAARDVSLAKVEAALDAGYGAFAGSEVQWAELRFAPEAAQWVANEQWHPRQQGRLLADGSLHLRLPYVDPTELVMDLLRHGDQVVRVEAPPELREAVRSAHARAAAAG
ncbi:MAG: WYL domain-containing protein [Ideonella sp.]|nr:WYL domain-containing protein [Ideonella sp.]